LRPEDQLLPESEESHWIKLLKNADRLRALFLRGNSLTDKDVASICKILETN